MKKIIKKLNKNKTKPKQDDSFYDSASDIEEVDEELSEISENYEISENDNNTTSSNKKNDKFQKNNFIDKPKITKLYSRNNKEIQVNKYKIETNAVIHYTKGEYITLVKFPINSDKFYVRCDLSADIIKYEKDGSYESNDFGNIKNTYINSDYNETIEIDSCGRIRPDKCNDFRVRRLGSDIYCMVNLYSIIDPYQPKLSCLLTLHLNCINDQKFIIDYLRILHHYFSRNFPILYDTNLTKEIIKYLIPDFT